MRPFGGQRAARVASRRWPAVPLLTLAFVGSRPSTSAGAAYGLLLLLMRTNPARSTAKLLNVENLRSVRGTSRQKKNPGRIARGRGSCCSGVRGVLQLPHHRPTPQRIVSKRRNHSSQKPSTDFCNKRSAITGREQSQQGGSLYSITPSARVRSVGGTSRPSAFAVLRLTTRLNLVGYCTGSSATLAPLRMRSAYAAPCRNWST